MDGLSDTPYGIFFPTIVHPVRGRVFVILMIDFFVASMM